MMTEFLYSILFVSLLLPCNSVLAKVPETSTVVHASSAIRHAQKPSLLRKYKKQIIKTALACGSFVLAWILIEKIGSPKKSSQSDGCRQVSLNSTSNVRSSQHARSENRSIVTEHGGEQEVEQGTVEENHASDGQLNDRGERSDGGSVSEEIQRRSEDRACTLEAQSLADRELFEEGNQERLRAENEALERMREARQREVTGLQSQSDASREAHDELLQRRYEEQEQRMREAQEAFGSQVDEVQGERHVENVRTLHEGHEECMLRLQERWEEDRLRNDRLRQEMEERLGGVQERVEQLIMQDPRGQALLAANYYRRSLRNLQEQYAQLNAQFNKGRQEIQDLAQRRNDLRAQQEAENVREAVRHESHDIEILNVQIREKITFVLRLQTEMQQLEQRYQRYQQHRPDIQAIFDGQ